MKLNISLSYIELHNIFFTFYVRIGGFYFQSLQIKKFISNQLLANNAMILLFLFSLWFIVPI